MASAPQPESACKGLVHVHYLGHASFVLRFDQAVTILTDYGQPEACLREGWKSPIHDIGDLVPDVLTYSHMHHADHYDPDRVPRSATHVLTKQSSLAVADLAIEPMRTSEVSLDMIENTSFLIRYRDLKILHLGDCQANITHFDEPGNRRRLAQLFPIRYDLVMIPIESTRRFPQQAAAFIDFLLPRRIIPMHYSSEASRLEFLQYLASRNGAGRERYSIQTADRPDYVLTADRAGDSPITVVVLNPSDYVPSRSETERPADSPNA